MQTALHITALVAEIERELVGGKIVATAFYKKERAAYIHVRKDKTTRGLGFVYHPAGSGCFCVPASKVKLETREKPWPVLGISQGEILGVRQYGLDRIFGLRIRQDDRLIEVVFEAIGPNGNLWLLDDRLCRQGTLRRKTYQPNEPYVVTALSERLDPFEILPEQIEALLAKHGLAVPTRGTLVATLKKYLLGLNETMVREALARAGFESEGDAGSGRAEAVSLAREIKEIASRFKDAQSGYLYTFRRGTEVYPFRLSGGDVQPEKFKTLSLAVMAMVTRRRSAVEGEDREKGILKVVTRAVKRLERRLVKLAGDVEKASGFEKCKRYAELLQIHRGDLKKGMRSVEVDDVMSDPARTVKIKLDPALSPNENIEQYFRQHRKGREGLSLLKRRLEVSEQELQSLEEMQQELEADFNSAEQRYQSEISSLMPRERQPEAIQPRLPYKEATLSTGVTIFIGRDGSDNDRTTFEFTRPYELWFHAQQCPGSHVVIKYPGKSFEPSKREIEETAAIAAYHSRARNDSLVPVIYTQRKHVRKPRKAKPGLVLVEREKSIMVEPKKPG